MSSDRRRAPRYQFVAEAEVIAMESRAKVQAKTGDLSIGGCFLGMRNPVPEGQQIQLTIWKADRSFSAVARVVFVFPNLGMGVAFTEIPSVELTTLEEWLADLERNRFDAAVMQGRSGKGVMF